MFTDIIRTGHEAGNVRFAASSGYGFQCCECWQEKPILDGATGYGRHNTHDGLTCYECCHKHDINELRDQSKPLYAYVSCDGKHVTNWPGGKLGAIHAYAESSSGWHGAKIARFHVLDVHGQWWQGRGAGHSMCCVLRKMKTPSYAKNWGTK